MRTGALCSASTPPGRFFIRTVTGVSAPLGLSVTVHVAVDGHPRRLDDPCRALRRRGSTPWSGLMLLPDHQQTAGRLLRLARCAAEPRLVDLGATTSSGNNDIMPMNRAAYRLTGRW